MRWKPILAIAFVAATTASAIAYTQQQQQELAIGKQEYQQLAQQGKIVRQSRYYSILNPIAHRIAAVADKQYFMPFHFYLVNDGAPNAFSVPGGNVYVTMSMMTFAQNKEELAGVLCHEVSHDIHHDVINLNPKEQTVGIVGGILGALVGNSGLAQTVIGLGANAEVDAFSRQVETNADHTGAYICAQAGYNPWGMVWLMQRFETKPSGVPLEMLSNHPRDDHRVSDLEAEFRADPATFGRFNPNKASATPL